MKTQSFLKTVATKGDGHVIDLTAEILDCVEQTGIQQGLVNCFVPGSTAGFTTIEYESGVVQDVSDCLNRLAPRDFSYAHERAWHDGNGYSHVRAALLGPSLTIPIADGKPVLGTWQQVVLIDFDNKARQRKWCVTIMGGA